VNRHGISQNPTAEESALLRKLWDGDNARARAQRLRNENRELEAENARLRAERDRLLADQPESAPVEGPE
jgi:hypothetical protein